MDAFSVVYKIVRQYDKHMSVELTGSVLERPVHHSQISARCHLCHCVYPTDNPDDPQIKYLHFSFLPKPYVVVCQRCELICCSPSPRLE